MFYYLAHISLGSMGFAELNDAQNIKDLTCFTISSKTVSSLTLKGRITFTFPKRKELSEWIHYLQQRLLYLCTCILASEEAILIPWSYPFPFPSLRKFQQCMDFYFPVNNWNDIYIFMFLSKIKSKSLKKILWFVLSLKLYIIVF